MVRRVQSRSAAIQKSRECCVYFGDPPSLTFEDRESRHPGAMYLYAFVGLPLLAVTLLRFWPSKGEPIEIEARWFDAIRAGRKTVEGRKATGKWMRIRNGDR